MRVWYRIFDGAKIGQNLYNALERAGIELYGMYATVAWHEEREHFRKSGLKNPSMD